MPCTNAASGFEPSVKLKVSRFVKVCAGEATAVMRQNMKTMQIIFKKLDFLTLPPSGLRRNCCIDLGSKLFRRCLANGSAVDFTWRQLSESSGFFPRYDPRNSTKGDLATVN